MEPSLEGLRGQYFEGLHVIRSSVDSYDRARAEELWQASAALTGFVQQPTATAASAS